MTNSRPPILLAGSNCADFTYEIANKSLLETKPMVFGKVYHHQFPSGEWYCQIQENIRGADVFLVQTISYPANDNLMQLLIMADAARRASAGRITAIIPYLGYSRQDRKDKSRVPISAKLVMDIIAAAGINRVVTMDLHAPQIAGFTNLPFDHLHFLPCLTTAVAPLGIETVVAPDVGAVKRAETAARKMNVDLAIITKRRKSDTEVEATSFIGDVKGKNVLVIDDLTESAGTIVQAAKICKEQGAAKVYGAVTHAAITNVGTTRLAEAIEAKVLDGFYFSNTIIQKAGPAPQINVVDVSGLFSKAINCIHNDESISSLFE